MAVPGREHINLCRFDEWQLSATIEMLGTNVNVSGFLFKNYVG